MKEVLLGIVRDDVQLRKIYIETRNECSLLDSKCIVLPSDVMIDSDVWIDVSKLHGLSP